MSAEPLLAGRDLVRRFERRGGNSTIAVERVSIELERCAAVGLVGESGSGKTTVGRLLAGLDVPTSGEVRFEGRPLAELDAAVGRRYRRAVQYVFQDPVAALNPRATVRSSLSAARTAFGAAARPNDDLRDLVERVGLEPGLLDRYPHELSGGQAQRVVIARALAVGPAVLILDEPTSALDVSVQAQILALLARLRAELGLGLLLISHDLAVVEQLCERALVMKDGRIVEQGECERLFRSPRADYTRRLVEAVPVPGRSGRRPGAEHRRR